LPPEVEGKLFGGYLIQAPERTGMISRVDLKGKVCWLKSMNRVLLPEGFLMVKI
jgi:hypothetical protein